ncbi:acetyl/propionyl/methylcrotonyl-CoA carboxylase subunit alpha [Leisingera sp. ANG-Vp]|uniref:acetyl/propionyl/methylcrotonyl-CoA carboxylase subunit alpha n=1 Tax=Leisingera sp. ANG-Vp TaxID=1577896 RepID=UPI0009E3FB2B|nr:biotin carboxylase N-terminal domain-containing protein [Leisingera sp. ANG-Vp]
MGSFDTILVANRGEIALRVMRTARAMGLKCVAVFTDPDAESPHVAFADRAVRIGEGPAADSYLSIEKLIEAARGAGAGAVHPGYGFLSENAAFARACVQAGLVFIGPPPEAIALMGDKAAAKRKMIDAGVPCIAGYEGAEQAADELAAEAGRIGFPLMIKAAAGGGGKGMRLVERAADFRAALELARGEALPAFGSEAVILERALQRPRHVEVQVLGDAHGTVIHLGERDCSVQRRHQKVVEEAPCPAVDEDLRARMGAAAVAAAKAIGYQGAGTVEFLLDQDGTFYFLEMNTRLQVEHPVTEMITGLDLVEMQIRAARGEPLGVAQHDVRLSGHAIEARLYAEDPAQGFLPQAGRVEEWRPPAGEEVRVDDGIAAGQEVSPHYDPLLAKVIARGRTREEARHRLAAALRDCVLFGPVCNRDFLLQVLAHPEFAAGGAVTDFIPRNFPEGLQEDRSSRCFALGAALLHRARQTRFAALAGGTAGELLGWSNRGMLTARFSLAWNGKTVVASVSGAGNTVSVSAGEDRHIVTDGGDGWRVDGELAELKAWQLKRGRHYAATGVRIFSLAEMPAGTAADPQEQTGRVSAPMHGTLLEISVSEGCEVAAGSRLAVLEAMKMQHEIRAAAEGRVVSIAAQAGTQVQTGDLLLEIESLSPETRD